MINQQALKELIEQYKKDLPDHWEDEKYKWVALKRFKDNWDDNAQDFRKMYSVSMAKTGNLLGTQSRYPRRMIRRFAELDEKATQRMFQGLFDESLDLKTRIEKFIADSDVLLKRFDTKNEGKHHYQDINAISTYLWLRYPDKYYIYKYRTVEAVTERLNADFRPKFGNYSENIIDTNNLYEKICAELKKDSEVREILSGLIDSTCWPDESLHTATQDFGYFVYKLGKPDADTELPEPPDPSPDGQHYWWLSANPNIWSFSKINVGESVAFTLLNENNQPRRIPQNFRTVKVGDPVIGYEATPTLQVVAIGEISAEAGSEGKEIRVKKIEDLEKPVSYSDLANFSEFKSTEFFKNPNGTLFKLTKEQHDFIMKKIREENVPPKPPEKYKDDNFLKDVYITREDYKELVELLEYKKNVILQGPPGVGKTFAAKRLAYSIMGEKDDSRIEFVQFHQNYSYEDFVMGYKPKKDGFELKNGIFYEFCEKASKHPDKDYFFIIDEINRGNMSKIFGELLMLIENDKRGDDYRVKLPYVKEEKYFSIPKNLLIIGMMNTADRSLAMIDYALRRRFAFFTMEPAFKNDKFKGYLGSLKNEKLNKLIEQIKDLNDKITKDKSLGKDFCIGHSYFCGLEKLKDLKKLEKRLRAIVEFEVKPMINEYCFDDSEKSKKWIAILEGKTEGKSDGKSNGESDDKR